MDVYGIGWELGKRHGCVLICYEDNLFEHGVYLCILKCARKGTGSPCLESFISAMKAYGFRRIRLDAYPSAYSMGDAPPGAVERLVHWYERFGFRLNGEFTPDYFNGMSLPL